MDARLSILAAAQLIVVATSVAAADPAKRATLARELFDLGIDEFKAKQFDAASASMAKSYALDPQPEALYAQAQAERLAGNCKDALVHYQKLLDNAKDESTQSAVKSSITLCAASEQGEAVKAAAVDAQTAERRDAPTIQIRTVYRTEQHNDRLAIPLLAVGGVALGGALTTYLLASSTRADADHAQSLAEYNSQFDRARDLRITAYAAGATGIVLVGLATIRVIRGGKASRVSEVAVVPVRGGSMVSWAASW